MSGDTCVCQGDNYVNGEGNCVKCDTDNNFAPNADRTGCECKSGYLFFANKCISIEDCTSTGGKDKNGECICEGHFTNDSNGC